MRRTSDAATDDVESGSGSGSGSGLREEAGGEGGEGGEGGRALLPVAKHDKQLQAHLHSRMYNSCVSCITSPFKLLVSKSATIATATDCNCTCM